jgi:glutamate synthase domain-containing protein 2
LTFVHNALVGCNLRQDIRVIAAGKVVDGFGLARMIALGADLCYAARSMMMSIGCIQARRCNSNDCPVGIATQNPGLTAGLVVSEKVKRVARFHEETIHAALELIGASGLSSPAQLRPWHVMRRVSAFETRHYGEILDYLAPGALLGPELPPDFARAWGAATSESFQHVEDHIAA